MNQASKEQRKASRLMFRLYEQEFARHLRLKVFELADKDCYGCEVNHPSVALHTCSMWTEELELFDMYKDDAYQCCNDETLILWQNTIPYKDVPREAKFALLELSAEKQITLKEDQVFEMVEKMIKR